MNGADDGPDRDDARTDRGSGADGEDGESEPLDAELFGGPEAVPDPVEPGSPTVENAAFVLLGVLSMVALVVHLLSLLG